MRILLAIDGSPASEAAVRAVQTQPWPKGSSVRVLCVAEPVYPPPMSPWGGGFGLGGMPPPQLGTPLEDVNQHALDHASSLADQVASTLSKSGLQAEGAADAGDPRDVIISHANEWPADLIVLGSHGRTGLKRWILGSVAESVVRHAPCSVEVARPREAQPAHA